MHHHHILDTLIRWYDDPFPEVDIVVLPMNSSTASAIEEEKLDGLEKGQMGKTLGGAVVVCWNISLLLNSTHCRRYRQQFMNTDNVEVCSLYYLRVTPPFRIEKRFAINFFSCITIQYIFYQSQIKQFPLSTTTSTGDFLNHRELYLDKWLWWRRRRKPTITKLPIKRQVHQEWKED